MHRINTYNEENTIARSERDGWTLGYIGIPWPGPWPKKNGDLFVTDPNGWQVGISWESSGPGFWISVVHRKGVLGVFQVRFPVVVMSEDDLIRNFHVVLPLLKRRRALVTGFPS